MIDIIDPTAKTIEDLTNLNLPAGVDVEIKMQQYKKVIYQLANAQLNNSVI